MRRPAVPTIPVVFLCGLGAGFTSLAIRLFRKSVLHSPLGTRWDWLWLVPVTEAAAIAVPALLVLAFGRILVPRERADRAAILLGAILAVLSITINIPGIAWWARWVLAVGVGHRVTARLTRAVTLAEARLGRGLVVLCSAIIAFAIGLGVARRLSTPAATAQVSPEDRGRPNVLLLVVDTERAQSTSLYGATLPTTPMLERLASDALVFDHGYSTAPWTLPSHASMMTGRYPQTLGVDWVTALDGRDRVLAEVFNRHGYLTAGFVANTGYGAREFGLHRGFQFYEAKAFSPAHVALSSSLLYAIIMSSRVRTLLHAFDVPARKSAASIVDRFLAWRHAHAGRPYFAFLNLYDAHSPYLPPSPYAFAPEGSGVRRLDLLVHTRDAAEFDEVVARALPPSAIDAERRAYDGALRYIDAQIGRLVDSLKARGDLDNTVLIVTSDHGEQFGEHGRFYHSTSLFSQVLWVPLIIRYPAQVPQGVRFPGSVTLRDLAATILDLTGIEDSEIEGTSLRTQWQRGVAGSPILAALDAGRTLIQDSLYYVREVDGTEWLFDTKSDARTEHNLVQAPEYAASLTRLRLAIDTLP